MDEKREIRGYWWSPEQEEKNKMPGTLHLSSGKEPRLECMGAWGDDLSKEVQDKLIAGERFLFSLIWGLSSDGKKITLVNCHSDDCNINLTVPFGLYQFSVRYVLEGIHLDATDTPVFREAIVTIPALTHWAPPHAVSSVWEQESGKYCVYHKVDNLFSLGSVEMIAGFTLSLLEDVSSRFTGGSSSISQRTVLRLEATKAKRFRDFLCWIRQFEEFLSFVMLERTGCLDITLYTKGRDMRTPDNDGRVSLYMRTAPEKEQNFCPYFTYEAIKDRFPVLIKRWYDTSLNYEVIIDHLLAIIDPPVFNQGTFLTAIQAVDGVGRRECGKKLRYSLPDLSKRYERVMRKSLTDSEILEVIDSRNYYSHLSPQTNPHMKTGGELYYLTRKLRVLLVLLISTHLGLDEETIKALVDKSNNHIFE